MSRRTAASRSSFRGRALRRSPPGYRAGVRRAASLAAVLLAVLAGGSARTAPQPLFQFGRIGGNIQPFRVAIGADGTVAHSGPVRLANPNVRLSKARLGALLRYARTQRFWSLRRRTLCRDALPDVASLFVTIHTAARTRTVTVRGECSTRFSRIYRALAAATTVKT